MLTWLLNRSLGLKFGITVVIILVATTSLVIYFYIKDNHNFQVENLLSKGKSLGRFVSLISPQAVLSYDFEGMNDFMREIAQEEDVVYGVIISHNGKNLTHYLNESNPYIKTSIDVSELDDEENNILHIIEVVNENDDVIALEFPILFNQKSLGKLVLGVSLNRVNQNNKKVISDVLLTMAIIISILTILIYVGFRSMAMKPIRNLQRGLKQVTSGDLNTTISTYSEDEIGELTQSFNEMVVRLKQTNNEKDNQAHELEKLNQSLGDRVEESVRIMRDLHDDVGARLLTLVHRSESAANADTARDALHNLRETLRGLGDKQTIVDVNDALADWRDEARDRLDAAGIKLEWPQPDDFPEIHFTNRQLINLSRIIREGISNAIKHASPSVIKVSASIQDGALCFVMCNDGQVENPDHWEAGTGLNNMQTRSKELNATLKWYTEDGAKGTCLEIICPLIRVM